MGWLVKVWRKKNGDPIMREYQDRTHNPEVAQLTYANGDGRTYYIPGDCVLTGKHSLDDLQREYPELRRANTGDPSTLESVLEIALVFAGVEKASYATAWRIDKMEVTHVKFMGDGYLYMQRLLVLDETTPMPIGSQVYWSMEELNWSWRMKKMAEDWERTLIPMINAAVTVAEVGVTFGASTVTKIIARKAKRRLAKEFIKRGMRRVLRVAVRVLSQAVVKATLAAIKEFVLEVTKLVRAFDATTRLRQLSKTAATPFDWRGAVTLAVPKAAAAFVSTLLEAARESVFKKIDAFAAEALGLMPDAIASKIEVYLLKEVTDLFTIGAFDLLNRSVSSAITASLDSAGNFDEKKFGKELVDALRDQLSSLLTGKVTAIPEAVGDQIAELVTG
jgi:hypothetical protein